MWVSTWTIVWTLTNQLMNWSVQFHRWCGYRSRWWDRHLAAGCRSNATPKRSPRLFRTGPGTTGPTPNWCSCPISAFSPKSPAPATGRTWNSPSSSCRPRTSATTAVLLRIPWAKPKALFDSSVLHLLLHYNLLSILHYLLLLINDYPCLLINLISPLFYHYLLIVCYSFIFF